MKRQIQTKTVEGYKESMKKWVTMVEELGLLHPISVLESETSSESEYQEEEH